MENPSVSFVPIPVPGKVILLGEHAVVYGHPALCGALARGVSVQGIPGTGQVRFATPPMETHLAPPQVMHGFAQLLHAFLQFHPTATRYRSYDFIVTFHIPQAAGLGSSAALALALTRALCQTTAVRLSTENEFACAQQMENVLHGISSGLDLAICQQGGIGVYTRERGLQPLHGTALTVCIAWSGHSHSTKREVEHVRQQQAADPIRIQKLFRAIHTCVDQGVQALAHNEWTQLGHTMNTNHRLLQELGVSTPTLDALCETARAAGALGAKLTGAGGGGCIIALAPEAHRQVLAAWEQAGFVGFASPLASNPLLPKPLSV